ncbi:hypothetical protein GNF51_17080, partial [Clostridium perfringens]|nr:hypothetical protein [Clostridium perfringens]
MFGFLIGYIQGKTNINLLKTFGKKGIIATNFIGTTIHELSHYIMCIIFLHKVDKVKLFSFKLNDSGVLGEKINLSVRDVKEDIANGDILALMDNITT